MRAPSWVISLALLLGCDETADEFDPDRVHELARTEGSARGYGASGRYRGQLLPIECGCPQLLAEFDLAQTCDPPQTDRPRNIDLELVQADGWAALRGLDVPLTGALDADGGLTLGSVSSISALILELESVVVLEGQLDRESSPPRLTATLRSRSRGTLPLSDPERLDCRSTFELDLTRM